MGMVVKSMKDRIDNQRQLYYIKMVHKVNGSISKRFAGKAEKKMEYRVEEGLLMAWLRMSMNIRGNRILDKLSFNEIVVCSVLYTRMQEGLEPLTATHLCNHMKLLKSQLNKVLNSMEQKKLIERVRSDKDKRMVYIMLCKENLHIYLEEHQKVMHIVHEICSRLGEEKTMQLSVLMQEAVAVVESCSGANEPDNRKDSI